MKSYSSSFACFIITFERTDFIIQTIQYILSQEFIPSKILIVDNSQSNLVSDLVKCTFSDSVEILQTGKNLGPAGAAKIGLEKLTEEGFDWIYWGDDDDPPSDPKIFQLLTDLGSQNSNVGIIGKIGGRFIPNRARTRVVSNNEIKRVTGVDYVTGGKHMLVSADVVKKGILPNPDLFFGFEELDFCLRVKDAGFSILIDGQGILDARLNNGNNESNYRWRGKSFGRHDQLNRQYYSLRNLLVILKSRNEWLGFNFLLVKSFAKMIMAFRYGVHYGVKFGKSQSIAILHAYKGKLGQYNLS